MDVGQLIVSGYDCQLFEAGRGKVVRRSVDGRDMTREATVMRHARRHGFPVPEVFDVDGSDILMEWVRGPSMMDDLARRPWRLRSHARLLAELHRGLAAVPAPDGLPEFTGCEGDALLHRDLHPMNVLLTDAGPRVIDWANAKRGAPGAEVANTWVVLGTAVVDGVLPRTGRWWLVKTFLDHVDRDAARPYLGAIARRRRSDPHLTAPERAHIDRLVAAEARPPIAA